MKRDDSSKSTINIHEFLTTNKGKEQSQLFTIQSIVIEIDMLEIINTPDDKKKIITRQLRRISCREERAKKCRKTIFSSLSFHSYSLIYIELGNGL